MSVLTRDGVAPFIKSLLQMLDTPENIHLIRWGKTGESIVITNCAEFETKLLPKYFKTGKFCSFIRQLNIYGFHKVEDEKSSIDEAGRDASESQSARTFEFANDNFKKHHPEFMINIKRRKSVRRSLTLNNNNPNNYRAFPPMNEEDDENDGHTNQQGVQQPQQQAQQAQQAHNINNPLNLASTTANHLFTQPNVIGTSSLPTPNLSSLNDIKLGSIDNSNSSDHAILQQLLYQFTKSQVDFNELKYSNQQLQESHTQLQYAFQSLQQSHQNLLERVLKLTKAILGHSILYTQYSQNNLQSKQNNLVNDLQTQSSPNSSTSSLGITNNQNGSSIGSSGGSLQNNIASLQQSLNFANGNTPLPDLNNFNNFILPLSNTLQASTSLENPQQQQQQSQQSQQQQYFSSPQQQSQQHLSSPQSNIHQSPPQQQQQQQQQQLQNNNSQNNNQNTNIYVKDELLQNHEDTNKNLQDFILEQELFSSLQNGTQNNLTRSKIIDPSLTLSQNLMSNNNPNSDQYFNPQNVSTSNLDLNFNFYN